MDFAGGATSEPGDENLAESRSATQVCLSWETSWNCASCPRSRND